MEISVHNSSLEVSRTPEYLAKYRFEAKTFEHGGKTLPYCQKLTHPELPGEPDLIVYLHGMGSVGHDNFLQIRIPAEPLVSFCEKHDRKTVQIYPQCEKDFQWVDVPWNTESHTIPAEPSVYLSLALALLDEKLKEFKPAHLIGLGVSMGGYGIWDMACRSLRAFDALGVMCGGADTSFAPSFTGTRVWITHGSEDPAVPVCRARDMYAALCRAGCRNLVYRELAGVGHNAWDPFFATENALAWLFGEKLTSGRTETP